MHYLNFTSPKLSRLNLIGIWIGWNLVNLYTHDWKSFTVSTGLTISLLIMTLVHDWFNVKVY